jgi:hypothetical protein
MFFGFHLAVLGYLIFKSGYFPKILGVVMVFAALGYLIDAYGNILYPTYAETFGLVAGVGALIRELPFLGTSIFPLACDQRRKRPTLQRKGATATLGYA